MDSKQEMGSAFASTLLISVPRFSYAVNDFHGNQSAMDMRLPRVPHTVFRLHARSVLIIHADGR